MAVPSAIASRDADRVPTLMAVSDVDFVTPVAVAANPTTGAIDISGTISATNPSVSATGSAVPASATYLGVNVAGNLRGQTGVNPSGSIYAAQTDLASVGGTSIALGQAAMAASLPVVLASNQTAIPLKTNDTVDANNSSTATLLANASFTGTGTDTLGYTSVGVYVYSDQSSATNGVKIEFSSDNTNWNDSTTDSFTAGNPAPNDGQTYIATLRARYFRVVYTNGAVNQTAFRLNTVLRVGTLSGDVIPVADLPNSIADHALLTKASIVGKTTAGGGAFLDVKVNPSGALTVASTTQDSAGNNITSNSTTTTSTFGLDVNIRSILNTAPTTAGFLDIKGADGNVFVRQATAANLNATVVGTGTFAVQAAQSGNWSVRNQDGAGNALTTNSTTYTAKFALDSNLLGTLGTAFSTAGKVDVKGADGDVFVRQTTGSNLHTVVDSGTITTVSTLTTITNAVTVSQGTATNLKAQVVAGDATGSAVPANAYYQASRATTSLPTAATSGNLTGNMSDKFGRQVVVAGTIRDLKKTQTTTISASTSETTVVTAGAAGIFNDIVMFMFTNTSATGTRVDIRDATAGSVIFSIWVPANDTRGFTIPGETLPQTTAANNWTAQSSASITDLRVFAMYEQNK